VSDNRGRSRLAGELAGKRQLEPQTTPDLRRSGEQTRVRVCRERTCLGAGGEHAYLRRLRRQGSDLGHRRGQRRMAGVDLLGDEDDSRDQANGY
jgi:hypothetical protein